MVSHFQLCVPWLIIAAIVRLLVKVGLKEVCGGDYIIAGVWQLEG
ncbi:MAG: hypothetical protein AB1345_00020 [Chloroflexota bacterium]